MDEIRGEEEGFELKRNTKVKVLKVCSRHFKQNDFNISLNEVVRLKNGVPSKFCVVGVQHRRLSLGKHPAQPGQTQSQSTIC